MANSQFLFVTLHFIFLESMIWQLFWTFFKIGAFTFGSGYAMVPLIEKEIVEKKKWFEHDDFINQFTLAQMSPGPFSLNIAVFVGYKQMKFWGALFAVIGLVIPSFLIILFIAVYLSDFRENTIVNNAFRGIRPAVIALIAVPFIHFLQSLQSWLQYILAIISAILICFCGISPIYFLTGGAIIGILVTYLKKQ